MRWVTMRLMSTGADAQIPAGAVDAHRMLGWLPVDEIPDTRTAGEPTGETPDTGTVGDKPAGTSNTRRRSQAGTTAQEG